MGYVVYNTSTGRAERYYKQLPVARAQATKLNRDPYRNRFSSGEFRAVSYAAYEGVLMGLKDENLRYWSWMTGR